MSKLKQFTVTEARPLPVIILADTSGSMGVDGKIGALNGALKAMVNSFSQESRLRAEIHLGVITFGGGARSHLPFSSVGEIEGFDELKAAGGTPMGAALNLVHEWLEDKVLIPSRAYRPLLILISDGLPTDDWEQPFEQLKSSERAQKATRLAMAIGADADEGMLTSFINDLEAPLFHAHNAQDIHRFFRAVTMSVTTQSVSNNPNQAVLPDLSTPNDDLDLNF